MRASFTHFASDKKFHKATENLIERERAFREKLSFSPKYCLSFESVFSPIIRESVVNCTLLLLERNCCNPFVIVKSSYTYPWFFP